MRTDEHSNFHVVCLLLETDYVNEPARLKGDLLIQQMLCFAHGAHGNGENLTALVRFAKFCGQRLDLDKCFGHRSRAVYGVGGVFEFFFYRYLGGKAMSGR
jgi:hypothetical protein